MNTITGEENIIDYITRQYHISGNEQQRIIRWYLGLTISDKQEVLNITDVYNQKQLVLVRNDTLMIV